MNTNAKMNRFALLMILAASGSALAQGPVYASGLAHVPTGAASATALDARSIRVANIGSSGQDGVSVQLGSGMGGGVSIDPGVLPINATIGTARKGWDGTIKGRDTIKRLSSNTYELSGDFSGLGAASVRVIVYGDGGVVLTDNWTDGPVYKVNFSGSNFDGLCPDMRAPRWYKRWAYSGGSTNPENFEYWEFGCPRPQDQGDLNYRVAVIPILPAGMPGDMGYASVDVTAKGVSQMTVSDADIATFTARSHGLGGGRMSERCIDPLNCSPLTRGLVINNIGSSGQDGVAIELGRAKSVEYQASSPKAAGGGPPSTMVTSFLTSKKGWDQKKNVRMRQAANGAGRTDISWDLSEFGNAQVAITTSLGGTTTGSGSGNPAAHLINTNTLDWKLRHPNIKDLFNTMRITGLASDGQPIQLTLIDNGVPHDVLADTITIEYLGVELPDAIESVSFTETDTTAGHEIDVNSLTWESAAPICPPDFDGDGFVTGDDFDGYVLAFENGDASADFNGDGFVNGDDFDAFVAAFEAGC